ncbi:beta ketoadipyl CoA thiolase, th1, partial [Haplosporangium bisporale]
MSRNASDASGGDTLSGTDPMKAFQSPDAILEPDIMTQLTNYMKDGGQPLLLVNALSSSYVGMPEMCNLMAGWATEFDIDPVEVMQEAVKEQLMSKFDPEGVDLKFMSGS